ncbi:MAG: hypothetical protein ONB48_05450 [candidate division KSB1 bacterium]|nr:hypothetical protein [candidate division KSB1 bacterium]MDZ7272992.1 hypothetical protein [candidate division KSB1 bacterium]MDZ7285095.1 hypothetical protein [candidate division KSB1 bacterium]MDZ7298127.1 hypothetical protein [candidate division KSB1 bacterium]MDZ7309256.1 hypothetical protein [candidate division KSB1 bacterium]
MAVQNLRFTFFVAAPSGLLPEGHGSKMQLAFMLEICPAAYSSRIWHAGSLFSGRNGVFTKRRQE